MKFLKRSKKLFAFTLVLVLLLGTLTACGGNEDVTTGGDEDGKADNKDIKIGMVPKFTGVDYFIAVENGAKKAAEDLGIKLDWQGDPGGQESAAKQKAYIQTFIDKGYDAILVSALDADSYAETLRTARKNGIKVITYDADVTEDARDFFVNQCENDELGATLMRNMAEEVDEGVVAIVSTNPNASNQNAWIEAIQKEYESKKDSDYSHITFFDKIIYAGDNQADADTAVNTLLTQNDDIKGIFAISSMAVPATAKACTDLNKPIGSISIQGVGVPQTVKDDIDSGLMQSVILWQPYDLGYLAVEFATEVVKGNVDENATSFKSSLSGNKQLADINYEEEHKITSDKQLILGKPLVFNSENMDGFKGYPNADSGLDN